MLTVTQMLRKKGVVGKFVEFFGDGLDHLTLADRATIANMAPEYGATCGFFPVDAETLEYLKTSAVRRSAHRAGRGYAQGAGPVPRTSARRSGLHRHAELDLGDVVPSMAGPKRPEGRVAADRHRRPGVRPLAMESLFKVCPPTWRTPQGPKGRISTRPRRRGDRRHHLLHQHLEPERADRRGPAARARVQKGLTSKPWVKTSLAPGSPGRRRISGQGPGLQKYLDSPRLQSRRLRLHHLHRQFRPAAGEISETINDNGLVAAAVLSGNRNFEGRVSPDVQANYLASPPLVVAYALAGTVNRPDEGAARHGQDGKPVFLKDIWPTTNRDRGLHPQERHQGVQERNIPTCSRATNWRRSRRPPARPTPGTWVDLRAEPALFRRHDDDAGRSRTSRARPAVRRQDHHRPHLARRFDQGGLARRQYLTERQVSPPTSTSTARAAATTK